MTDVIVTVPKSFGLDTWIAEGDAAGEPWSGEEWHFYLGGYPPKIEKGECVYVCYNGKLRGYAPLARIEENMVRRVDRLEPSPPPHGFALVRHNDAVAVTIPEFIQGFRGFRYRWWSRDIEVAFPEWQQP
jgi:hypothetical protein